MEITQTPRTTTPSPEALPPPGPVRRALAGLAVVATLPYLALKVSWLAGARVGLSDPDFGNSASMDILNGLTLMLDVVALALALVFLTRRGLRAPAWLVVPPMWIGAGLLGQILVTLPVGIAVRAFSPAQPSTAGPPPIEPWIFTMVYSGFALLGVGLLGAFALYARQRWGGRELAPVTDGARVALGAAAGLVGVGAVAHLLMAAVPLETRFVDVAVAAIAIGSLLALARPALRGQAAVATVVVAFVATGAVTAWGTYLGVITAMPNDLVGQTGTDWSTVVSQALRALSGFAAAGALALRLRRPRHAARVPRA